MTYSAKIAPCAEGQLRTFDPPARRRVQAAIDLLASDPRPPKAIQPIGGSGEWRVRTGEYRIIYEIHDDQLIVFILRLRHRREIYESR